MMDEFKGEDALDALRASAQTVEHCEIAPYGISENAGMKERRRGETLREEIRTDKLLSDHAMKNVNNKAA